MKKYLLLLACGALLFVSCGSNNNRLTKTDAQIDSTVNAKLAQHDAENGRKNDSIINAEAKLKADAEAANMEHAAKKEGDNTTNPATATTPTTAATHKAAPVAH